MRNKPVFHALYKNTNIMGLPPTLFYIVVGGCVALVVLLKKVALAICVLVFVMVPLMILYRANPEWVKGFKFMLKVPYYKSTREAFLVNNGSDNYGYEERR